MAWISEAEREKRDAIEREQAAIRIWQTAITLTHEVIGRYEAQIRRCQRRIAALQSKGEPSGLRSGKGK